MKAAERLPRMLDSLRARTPLAQIAASEGVSRQRLYQILAAAGHTLADFPVSHCHYCDAPLARRHQPSALGWNACLAPICQQQRQRDYDRSRQPPREHCACCDRELLYHVVRTDDRPRFCHKSSECNAARTRWYYANSKRYRQQVRASNARAAARGYFREYFRQHRKHPPGWEQHYCACCGEPTQRWVPTPGPHYCGRRECRSAYNRARWLARQTPPSGTVVHYWDRRTGQQWTDTVLGLVSV